MGPKHTFVVGRRTRRGMLVVIVQQAVAPIRGPWTLTAVVSAN